MRVRSVMRGIFVVEKNRTEILELPEPKLRSYEALVQVQACGICNSTDWKIIEGEFVGGTFPILLGHESVGRIIEVGKKVRNFKVGDFVLRSMLFNEHIPFRRGRSCWGGFVEKAVVTDEWAKKGMKYNSFPHPQQIIPNDISPVHAVAMITLKENLSCLNNSCVKSGHSLAIVGTGPVAQSLTLWAKLSGIKPTVVFGRRFEWAERFTKLGADSYVAGNDFPPEVQNIMDRGGFDRAIEAVGARAALSRCLQVLKTDGRTNLYGIAPESEPYIPEELSDPRVFRSKIAEADAHDELLDWINRDRVNLADWVSHKIHWTEYKLGFEMVREKKSNKVVLTFSQC